MSPSPGLQTFHEGRPVELLYVDRADASGQFWRVRPIFVEGPEREEFIPRGTQLRPIHGSAA